MTTVTCTYTREPGVPKTGLFLFMPLILAIVTAIWAAPQLTAPRVAAITVPPIVYEKHAEKHGPDALALRQCLNDKGGAAEIWRSFDKKYFYLLCELPDGRWGFVEIVKDLADRQWHEVTTFVRDNPTINALRDYLRGFGHKFNGPYPW